MKKLSKNFHEQKRTVEAMQGACGGMFGSCACGPVVCSCSDQSTNSYNSYQKEYTNYTNAYKGAQF